MIWQRTQRSWHHPQYKPSAPFIGNGKKWRRQGGELQDARMRLCVSGWALITVRTQDAAITVYSMAVLKGWLERPSRSSLFCHFSVCVKDNRQQGALKRNVFSLGLVFRSVFVVFAEVGKNINEDLSQRLKRFVEDYHKYAQSLNVPKPPPKTAKGQRAKRREGNFTGDALARCKNRISTEEPSLDVCLPIKVLSISGCWCHGEIIGLSPWRPVWMTNDIMSERSMNLLSPIRCGGRGLASNSLFLNINTFTSISQDTWKFKNVIITCPLFFFV